MSALLDQVKADTGMVKFKTVEGNCPVLDIYLTDKDKYPLQLRLWSAKKILANIQAIRAFVQTIEEEQQ